MVARTVTLTAKLTETDEVLKGTRAWVAKIIEESTIKVANSTKGQPCVFLKHPSGTVCLANFGERYDGMNGYDHWPFEPVYPDDYQLLGVRLTNAGANLLQKFSKKCLTLLKYRMRKQNRAFGDFKVRLVEEKHDGE